MKLTLPKITCNSRKTLNSSRCNANYSLQKLCSAHYHFQNHHEKPSMFQQSTGKLWKPRGKDCKSSTLIIIVTSALCIEYEL